MTGHHETDGKPDVSEADAPNPKPDTPQDPSKADAAATGQGAASRGPEPEAETTKDAADPAKAIAALEVQVSDLTDRLLRAHAEMDNLRKRTEREKADTAKYAITKFALDMVAIGDNLQRATDAAGAPESHTAEMKAVFEGVALTSQELGKALTKHGVEKIEAQGKLFDPHLHQAMMEQPNPEVPSGTILQVFQDGYRIGERVLRPSMVVVARGGMKPKPAAEAAGTSGESANGGTDAGTADARHTDAKHTDGEAQSPGAEPGSDGGEQTT